jgi:replicative DNA helicase
VDIEHQFLTKILDEGDLGKALESRITAEFFEDDFFRDIYTYLLEFNSEYAEVPTHGAVKLKFPDWKPVKEVIEPMQFFLDELQNAREYAVLHSTLVEVRAHLAERETKEAMAVMGSALTRVNIEVTSLRDTDMHADTAAWLDDYLALPEGLIGIPTGFPTLDNALGGWQPEQLITLVGPPKAGKSTIMMALADFAVLYGYRVFFTSFEMSAQEQKLRYYAMVGGINYQKLLHRTLNPLEVRQLRTNLRQREAYPEFIMSTDVSATATIPALAAKIEQYQPDVVFIDGVYMMDAQVDADPMSPQALTTLTRGLKRMAQNFRKPVVSSTQALASRYSKRSGLRTKDIGYTSSFAQDSDALVGVEHYGETDDDPTRRLSIMDARNAAKTSCLVDWDWSTSTFREMEGYDELNPADLVGDPDDV